MAKLELALGLIDEVRSWGLKDRLALADSEFGHSYEFRQALRSRGFDYVVQVEGDLTGWTEDPHPFSKASLTLASQILLPLHPPSDLSPPEISLRGLHCLAFE